MKSKRNTAKTLLRVLAGAGIAAAFVGALVIAARLGTDAALARLPASARQGIAETHPVNVEVLLGRDGEPVFLARSKQALRDFFFSHPQAEARRAAETESSGLRRFVGEIRVRTVRQDADLMNVEVLAGALNGDFYWLHLSQLPAMEAEEAAQSEPELKSDSESRRP